MQWENRIQATYVANHGMANWIVKKPKFFVFNVGLFVFGTLLLLLAALLGRAEVDSTLTLAILLLGGVAIAGGVVAYLTRQERQNQRTNAKLLQMWESERAVQGSSFKDSQPVRSMGGRSSQIAIELRQALAESGLLTKAEALEMLTRVKSSRIPENKGAANGSAQIAQALEADLRTSARDNRERPAYSIRPTSGEDIGIVQRTPKQTVRKLGVKIAPNLPAYDFLELANEPLKASLEVSNCNRADVRITVGSPNGFSERRAAVLAVAAFDQYGNQIEHRVLNSYSDKFGYFSYLAADGERLENCVTLSIPVQAKVLELEIHRWAGSVEISNDLTISLTEQNTFWNTRRKATDVKVAAILDEFSSNCFRYECEMISLSPEKWKEQMDDFQPDVFLCESAWSGADSDSRPWKGRVYSSSNFPNENRRELLDILEYCKRRNIPTVFWNKEDPSHYDDKRHNFVDTALKFDHIFTTDLASVNRYKKEYAHPSVNVLPFAVQPRLFNPLESGDRSKAVNFAGGWYSNHTSRCEAMDRMFNSVMESEFNLQIFDRFYGGSDESHFYPEEFRTFIKPAVPNDRVAEVYKGSEIGMTINTETKSPTMFARRIFELMACNTYVVSNFSEGVFDYFGDDVLYLDRNPDGLKNLSEEQKRLSREKNLIKVLKDHTYKKRFEQILDTVKVSYQKSEQAGAFIVSTSNWEEAEKAFDALTLMDNWRGPKVILLDANVDNLTYADALTKWNRHGVRVVFEKLLLNGECSVNEVFDRFEYGVLVNASDFFERGLDKAAIERMALHSQYIDLPIVSRTSVDSTKTEQTYRIVSTPAESPFLVSQLSLPSVLESRVKGKDVQAYCV